MASLLFLIGCLQMAGYVLGIPVIQIAGRFSGAAPLPLVFSPVNGYDYWASGLKMEIFFRTGKAVELSLDRAAVARIDRPHLLVMRAVLPLAAAPVIDPAMLKETLRGHFCRGWLLREAFAIREPVRSFRVSVSQPDGQLWERSMVCD